MELELYRLLAAVALCNVSSCQLSAGAAHMSVTAGDKWPDSCDSCPAAAAAGAELGQV